MQAASGGGGAQTTAGELQFGGLKVTGTAAQWLAKQQSLSNGSLRPTPIQAAAMRKVHAGASVALMAPTGTGKTLAYLLPLIQRLGPASSAGVRGPRFIVLCPSMDLQRQIGSVARTLLGGSPDSVLVLNRNELLLEQRLPACTVLVATTAHIIDFVEIPDLRSLWTEAAAAARAVVIDEADCLLPPGGAKDWLLGDVLDSIMEAKAGKDQNKSIDGGLQLVACSASIDETTLKLLGDAVDVKLSLVRAGGVQAIPMPEIALQGRAMQSQARLEQQARREREGQGETEAEEEEEEEELDQRDETEKRIQDARDQALAWLQEKDPKFSDERLDGLKTLTDFMEPTKAKEQGDSDKVEEVPEVDENMPFVQISQATREMRQQQHMAADKGLWPQGLKHYMHHVRDDEWDTVLEKGQVKVDGAVPYICRVISLLRPVRCLAIIAESRAPSERGQSLGNFVSRLRTKLLPMGDYRVSTVSSKVEAMSDPSGIFGISQMGSAGFGKLEDAKSPEVIVGRSEAIRGLDLPAIDCVVIVGRLQSSREYMHLAGRTARCATEREGPFRDSTVVSILQNNSCWVLKSWAHEMGFQISKLQLPGARDRGDYSDRDGGRRRRSHWEDRGDYSDGDGRRRRGPRWEDRGDYSDGDGRRRRGPRWEDSDDGIGGRGGGGSPRRRGDWRDDRSMQGRSRKQPRERTGSRTRSMPAPQRSVYYGGEDGVEELSGRKLGGLRVRRRIRGRGGPQKKVSSGDLFSFDD